MVRYLIDLAYFIHLNPVVFLVLFGVVAAIFSLLLRETYNKEVNENIEEI